MRVSNDRIFIFGWTISLIIRNVDIFPQIHTALRPVHTKHDNYKDKDIILKIVLNMKE